MDSKSFRSVKFDDLSAWEPLLKPGAWVIMRGANGDDYDGTLLTYAGGDLRLRRRDGTEMETYVENLKAIVNGDELISIIR